MKVETKYTIGESVIVKHYPHKLRKGYDVDKQEMVDRDGDNIDPKHVNRSEWIWIECTVEEIHVSEGVSRFRHDVKYKLRTNRKPLQRYKSEKIILYDGEGNPVSRTRWIDYLEVEPKRILKEKGEDKWFSETEVYKDMEHVIKRQDFKKQLPKQIKWNIKD